MNNWPKFNVGIDLPKFKIGTKFNMPYETVPAAEVIEIYSTYNNAGELTGIRYAAQFVRRGHKMIDFRVKEITVEHGLITQE